MNRRSAERDVVRLVQETAMGGSRREFPLDMALGGDGVGLDSLKLVEFVLKFEKKFGIRVPAEAWETQGAMNALYFVDLLCGSEKDR